MKSELIDPSEGIAWEYSLSENRHVYIGSRLTRVLGYVPEEWMGRDWQYRLDHIHPDDQERVTRAVAQIFWHEEWGELVYRMRARDGRYVWFHDTIRMDGDWATTRSALGVSVEIAGPVPFERLPDDPQHARWPARDRGEANVDSIAGEFNDILSAIVGFAELAAANPHVRDDPKLALHIDEIHKGGLRGSELLRFWLKRIGDGAAARHKIKS